MARKYRAMLDGFELKLQDISDSFRRALVRHSISYRDLPDLEDQGIKDREIRFRCFFLRDAYERHFDFIDHISSKRTAFILTHPVYGEIEGGIESIDIRHDKRQRTAEVDFTFAQAGKKEEPDVMGDIAGIAEDSFEAGAKASEAAVSQGAMGSLGAEADPVLDAWLDQEKGILEQLPDVTGEVRAFVGQLDKAVSTLEAALAEVVNPADSLVATISFTADLPGLVVRAIARAAERYAILHKVAGSAPETFIRNFRSSMDSLEAVLGLDDPDSGTAAGKARTAARQMMKEGLTVLGAQTAALELGYIFSGDETLRDRARKLEGVPSFDIRGRRIAADSPPDVLDVGKIERALAAVRQYIQHAVDRSRGQGSLKGIANDLLRHANEIKLEREKIIKIWMDNPVHIFLLCHAGGLPYKYAPRIMSLNPELDANFARGEVSVYERQR